MKEWLLKTFLPESECNAIYRCHNQRDNVIDFHRLPAVLALCLPEMFLCDHLYGWRVWLKGVDSKKWSSHLVAEMQCYRPTCRQTYCS